MRLRAIVAVVGLGVAVVIPSATGSADAVSPRAVHVCPPVPAGYARCMAEVVPAGRTISTPALSPATIKSIYNYPTSLSLGAGQTIAIVDPFDAPSMEADLGVFDTQFGLPDCTKANGCLTVVDQDGGTSVPPTTDPFWGVETRIDVEWVHAIAPGAKIVLVQTTDNLVSNLFQGVRTARTLAGYVSGSWGIEEAPLEGTLDHIFTDVPGVSFFFSSGDLGSAVRYYPAMSPKVTAVGGTTVRLNAKGALRRETGWSGSGGGCSQFETNSAAQAADPGYNKIGCAGKRAVPDVSAVGDPATGAAIYDSQPDEDGFVGWSQAGGTSLSAPIIAARAAGTGAEITQELLYSSGVLSFRDIRGGSNGFRARSRFDLVTGLGSWLN